VTEGLEAYAMADVGQQIYSFMWDEYADWYIEASKTRITGDAATPESAATARRTLVYVFDTCLRLLHPFMPYITEILWQQMPHKGEALMISPWPQTDESTLPVDKEAIESFQKLQDLVRSIRNARAEYQVDPGKKIGARVFAADAGLQAALTAESAVVSLLGRVDADALTVHGSLEEARVEKAAHLVIADGLECFLPLDALVDAAKERKRLSKQEQKMAKEVEGLEKRLKSSGFLDKASDEVIEETKAMLTEKTERLETIRRSLEDLN